MALGPESIPVRRPAPAAPPSPAPPAGPKRVPNYGRRIRWLGVGILVFIALYTAGWFWVANRLETEGRATLAALDQDPTDATCDNLHAEGFPFLIGLVCSRVAFADKSQGFSVEAGAFRSAAEVFSPFLVRGEVEGPAKVLAPDLPPLDLTWDVLKASVRLDQPLPDRVSVDARQFKAATPAGPLFAAQDAQAHMRPNHGDLDLAASFNDLTLNAVLTQGRTLPALDVSADTTLTGGVAWALSADKSLRGRSGVVRALTLSPGKSASLTLSGPFSVNEDGLLSADWTLALTGAPEMAEVLAQIVPEQADAVRSAFSGLALLGDKPSLPVRVDDGEVRLAFVTLGRVPPLQ